MGKWKPKNRPGQRGKFNPEEHDLDAQASILGGPDAAILQRGDAVPVLPLAPGISDQLDAWRATLLGLWSLRLWKEVPPDVLFHFEGGELEGAVVIVIGGVQGVLGVILYPNLEEFEALDEAAETGDLLAALIPQSTSLRLEPSRETTRADRDGCTRANLVIGGNRYVRVFATGNRTVRSATAREAELLLDACNGILGLWAALGPHVLQGDGGSFPFTGVRGEEFEVSVDPSGEGTDGEGEYEDEGEEGDAGPSFPPLTAPHTVFWAPRPHDGLGADSWCIVRINRTDFVEVRNVLEAVERLHWEKHEAECFRLAVWFAAADGGDLAHPSGPDVDSFRRVVAAGEVEVVVVEGSAWSNWWSGADVLWQRTLAVTGIEADAPASTRPVRTPSARRRT